MVEQCNYLMAWLTNYDMNCHCIISIFQKDLGPPFPIIFFFVFFSGFSKII